MKFAILAALLGGAGVWIYRYCFRKDGADAALATRIRRDCLRAEVLAAVPEPRGTKVEPEPKHASYGPNSQARAYMEPRT